MDHEGILRRLLTWQPWARTKTQPQTGRAAPKYDELRQRYLQRMVTRGMPLWREEPEHCDRCHRELLLGERAVLMSQDDDLLLACPLCAPFLEHEGYRSLTHAAAVQALPYH